MSSRPGFPFTARHFACGFLVTDALCALELVQVNGTDRVATFTTVHAETFALTATRERAHAQAASSDPTADGFDQVYAQHARFVFRVLRGMGVPDAQVDDALQDVFLVVHQRLSTFDRRARITTWLFQIALRIAHAYRRKGRRAHGHVELLDELPTSADSPLDDAEHAEQRDELSRLLAELDDDKRAVWVLAELEELTAPEIAELTGTPLNTVYTRLRRARAAFKALWHSRKIEDRHE